MGGHNNRPPGFRLFRQRLSQRIIFRQKIQCIRIQKQRFFHLFNDRLKHSPGSLILPDARTNGDHICPAQRIRKMFLCSKQRLRDRGLDRNPILLTGNHLHHTRTRAVSSPGCENCRSCHITAPRHQKDLAEGGFVAHRGSLGKILCAGLGIREKTGTADTMLQSDGYHRHILGKISARVQHQPPLQMLEGHRLIRTDGSA